MECSLKQGRGDPATAQFLTVIIIIILLLFRGRQETKSL
jgi:hypothetical protein